MPERVADPPVETWSLNDIDARLTHRFPRADWAMELTIANECCWSCEIRVTLRPNQHGSADRSYVAYAAGEETAEDAARVAVVEIFDWAAENWAG